MKVSILVKKFFLWLTEPAAKFLFVRLFKRFASYEKEDALYYKTPLGKFFFFKESGWPGKVESVCFNPSPTGDTHLVLIIKGQPRAGINDNLSKAIDGQLPEVDLDIDMGKTILMSLPPNCAKVMPEKTAEPDNEEEAIFEVA